MPQQSYDGIRLESLPPTPHELQLQRDRAIIEDNTFRERVRLRNHNQKHGNTEPHPGDVLYVQLDSTVKNRTRGGLRFEKNVRRTVRVVEEEGDELLRLQQAGNDVTDVLGAERILEDQALHVYKTAQQDLDVGDLQNRNAQLEEELRVTRAEHDALKRKIRDARMSAQPSDTGAPSRLNAARAAGEGSVKGNAADTEPTFGATESGRATVGDLPQQNPAPRPPAPTHNKPADKPPGR